MDSPKKVKIVGKWGYYEVDPHMISTHPVNYQKAFRYAKEMEKGKSFPAVQVQVRDDGVWYVSDGAHRTYAALLSGKKLLIKRKEA